MRTSLSILAAILGIAQLGAASSQGEILQAARVARDGFYKCAQMTVPEYDDQISPANVVAKAIAVKCQNWVNAMVQHMTQTEATGLTTRIMSGEDGNLLGVILHYRVLKMPSPLVARDNRSPSSEPVRSRQVRQRDAR